MHFDLAELHVGQLYSRADLAALWQYKSPDALRRGIVMPRSERLIILFVTESKSSDMTGYRDQLVGNQLLWEPDNTPASRIRMAGNLFRQEDEIVLFYRWQKSDLFTYMGRVRVVAADVQVGNNGMFTLLLTDGGSEQHAR